MVILPLTGIGFSTLSCFKPNCPQEFDPKVNNLPLSINKIFFLSH